MTAKLEAWKAWCDTTGTGDLLANQFTLDNSSHGKAFSFAWDAATETCAKVAESYEPRCDSCPSGVANAIRAREQQE